MKLKRIISALIVFTMVMACAVCSVSADGTYQVTTSYDISTKKITVNAAIADATDNSMVSYLIVAPDEDNTEDPYAVKEDGSNILHIDQATVADNAATFETLTADFDYLNNGKVKFVSTTDTLKAWETGLVDGTPDTWNYAKSVTKFTEIQRGVTVLNQNKTGGVVEISYVAQDGTVHKVNVGSPLNSAERWESDGMAAWVDGEYKEDYPNIGYFPIDAKALCVYVANDDGRRTTTKLQIIRSNTSLNGALYGDTNYCTIYDNTNDDPTKHKDLTINGFYKDDITDGRFNNITLEGGAVYRIYSNNARQTTTPNTAKVMSIDAEPIYGEYAEGEITYASVTFLVTATSEDIANAAGLKIVAYPKGTMSMDGTIPANKTGVELGICPNVYKGHKQFGIQLYDKAGEGYLDSTKYDLVATPVIRDVENRWTELTTMGASRDDGRYFTVSRTSASEN